MEKILAFIQWWMTLNIVEKILSFVLGISIFIAIIFVTLGGNLFIKKENLTLKETLQMEKDCNERALKLVAEERHKGDSALSIERKENKEQIKIFYQRTPIIEDRNNAIKNALK